MEKSGFPGKKQKFRGKCICKKAAKNSHTLTEVKCTHLQLNWDAINAMPVITKRTPSTSNMDRLDSGTTGFLMNLPCNDSNSFTHLKYKAAGQRVVVAPKLYTPTHASAEPPADQVIKTEKQNILLRHVYKQLELMSICSLQKSEAMGVKRPTSEIDALEPSSLEAERKRLRMDEDDDTMDNE